MKDPSLQIPAAAAQPILSQQTVLASTQAIQRKAFANFYDKFKTNHPRQWQQVLPEMVDFDDLESFNLLKDPEIGRENQRF